MNAKLQKEFEALIAPLVWAEENNMEGDCPATPQGTLLRTDNITGPDSAASYPEHMFELDPQKVLAWAELKQKEAWNACRTEGMDRMVKDLKKELEWIVSGDTGSSSEAIWCAMMGIKRDFYPTPCDPSDFGRCYRLLDQFHKFKMRIPELATLSAQWKVFAENWEKLGVLWLEEHGTGRCPKLYHLMKTLGF